MGGSTFQAKRPEYIKIPKAGGSWVSFKTERKPEWVNSVTGELADAQSLRAAEDKACGGRALCDRGLVDWE